MFTCRLRERENSTLLLLGAEGSRLLTSQRTLKSDATSTDLDERIEEDASNSDRRTDDACKGNMRVEGAQWWGRSGRTKQKQWERKRGKEGGGVLWGRGEPLVVRGLLKTMVPATMMTTLFTVFPTACGTSQHGEALGSRG